MTTEPSPLVLGRDGCYHWTYLQISQFLPAARILGVRTQQFSEWGTAKGSEESIVLGIDTVIARSVSGVETMSSDPHCL